MSSKDTRASARKATEVLVVAGNELGLLARITGPLAKNKVNIECYTGYEWGNEAAFRFVTDNNKRAREILAAAGFNAQENQVVLWQTGNTPGQLRNAATALAEASVNTICSYSTTPVNSSSSVVVFNTSDADRTASILNRLG